MRRIINYTCILCCFYSGYCFARNYNIEPYINAQEVYSDNINLNDNNKEDDFVTVLQPGLYATRNGPRFKARFNYALEQIIYADSSGSDETIHNLRTNALGELWKDHLFLDFSANNGQQNISSSSSLASDNISNAVNREDVFFYRVNPFWKQKISDVAKMTFGHTYDEILSDIGDSNSNFSYINITNGTRFRRLLFNFEANNRFIDIDGSPDEIRFTNIQNRFIYPVTRTLSATATLGYDDDDFVSNGDTSGVLWNVGFIWRPTQRTNVDVSAGERYYGSDFDIKADYAYGRTQFRLSYQRDQQTTRDYLARSPSEVLYERGASGLVDKEGNIIDDRSFISPSVLDAATISQTGGTTLSSTLRAVGVYTLNRNIFSTSFFYDENEFELSNGTIETYGVDFGWNRKLSRTMESDLNLVYQNRNLETGAEINDYLVDLVVVKQLSRQLNLFFGYSYSLFETDTATINEFKENRAFIGINKVF